MSRLLTAVLVILVIGGAGTAIYYFQQDGDASELESAGGFLDDEDDHDDNATARRAGGGSVDPVGEEETSPAVAEPSDGDEVASTAGGVTGRVVRADTSPIAGAMIVVRHAGRSSETTTDEAGRFLVAGLPALVDASVRIEASGFAPHTAWDVNVAKDGRRDLGTVTLEKGSGLAGVAKTTQGEPVADAKAYLLVAKGIRDLTDFDMFALMKKVFRDERAEAETTTDREGRFDFAQVRSGSYVVALYADGYEAKFSQTVDVVSGQRTEDVALELQEGRRLEGFVVNSESVGIVDAEVIFVPQSRGQQMPQFNSLKTHTDGDGKFVFTTLADKKRYQVMIRAEGYAPVSTRHKVGEDEAPRVVLSRGVRVYGRVTDAATDEGVAGVDVACMTMRTMSLAESVTDADGNYEIPHASTEENLRLICRAPGYTMVIDGKKKASGFPMGGLEIDRELAEGDEVRQDVRMSRGGTVTGRVFDVETNEGLAGATVRILSPSTFLSGGPSKSRAKTDDLGRFSITGVPDGPVRVNAKLDGYLPSKGSLDEMRAMMALGRNDDGSSDVPRVTEGGTLEGQDVSMRRAATVVGIVVDGNDKPVAGARVSTADVAGMMSLLTGRGEGPSATTDANGRFRLGGLPTDGVTINATHPEYPAGGRSRFDPKPDAPTEEIRIVVERGSMLQGTLLSVDGSAAAGIELECRPSGISGWQRDALTATTDAAGRFVFEGLPSGAANVRLENDRHGVLDSSATHIELARNQTKVVTLRLIEALTIAGVVVDERGEPMPQVAVSAAVESLDEDGENDESDTETAVGVLGTVFAAGNAMAFTNGKGEFTLNGLSPNTNYVITAVKWDFQQGLGEDGEMKQSHETEEGIVVESGVTGVEVQVVEKKE